MPTTILELSRTLGPLPSDGQIVVDATTYEDVSQALLDATFAELTLKGKHAPVAAYRIPP